MLLFSNVWFKNDNGIIFLGDEDRKVDMKKIFLSLSTLGLAATPVIAVVSCSGEEPKDNLAGQKKSNIDGTNLAKDLAKFDSKITNQSIQNNAKLWDNGKKIAEEELVELGVSLPPLTEGVKRTYQVSKVFGLTGELELKVTLKNDNQLETETYLKITGFTKQTEDEYKIDQVKNLIGPLIKILNNSISDQDMDFIASFLYDFAHNGLRNMKVETWNKLFELLNLPSDMGTVINNLLQYKFDQKLLVDGFSFEAFAQDQDQQDPFWLTLKNMMPPVLKPLITNETINGLAYGFENVDAFKKAVSQVITETDFYNNMTANEKEMLNLGIEVILPTIFDNVAILKTGIINASPENWKEIFLFDLKPLVNLLPKINISLNEQMQDLLKELQAGSQFFFDLANKVENEKSQLDILTSAISNFLQNGLDDLSEAEKIMLINLGSLLVPNNEQNTNFNLDNLLLPNEMTKMVLQVEKIISENQNVINNLLDFGLGGTNYKQSINDLIDLIMPLIASNLNLGMPTDGLKNMIVPIVNQLHEIIFKDIDNQDQPSADDLAQIDLDLAQFSEESKILTVASELDLPKEGQKLKVDNFSDWELILPANIANIERQYFVKSVDKAAGEIEMEIIFNSTWEQERKTAIKINGFKKVEDTLNSREHFENLVTQLLELAKTDLTSEQKQLFKDFLYPFLSDGLSEENINKLNSLLSSLNIPAQISNLLPSLLDPAFLNAFLYDGLANLQANKLIKLENMIRNLMPAEAQAILTPAFLDGLIQGFNKANDLKNTIWSALETGGFLSDMNWFTKNVIVQPAVLIALDVLYNDVPILKTGIVNAKPNDWIETITYNWDPLLEILKLIPGLKESLIGNDSEGWSDFENLQRILNYFEEVKNDNNGLNNVATGASNLFQHGFSSLTDQQLLEIVNLINWSINYGPEHPEPISRAILTNQAGKETMMFKMLNFIRVSGEDIAYLLANGLSGVDSASKIDHLSQKLATTLALEWQLADAETAIFNSLITNLFDYMIDLVNPESDLDSVTTLYN